MTAQDESALDRARSRVAAFDDLVRNAIRDEYGRNFSPPSIAAEVMKNDPVLRWDLGELVDLYVKGGAYPLDQLPGVADRAIDLKLQYRFVMITLGIHNGVVSGTGFDSRNPLSTPRLHLAHLCVMQTLIGQVRVLWERLMTLVYYLEEGKDPRGKSIRRVFFQGVGQWSQRWEVLREWEPVIDRYDSDFRTPEYHSRSRLRRELFGAATTDPNEILALLTPVMGGFWDVLIANVQGAAPHVIRLSRNVPTAGI